MTEFTDRHWQSRDGLSLHYRDYPGRDDRPPILCLPGLTRNARDFANLAEHLSGEWRVLCPELRGRGDSDYAKDPASYNPVQYLDDLGQLFEQAGIERFVAVGTSLGGLLTMMLAATGAQRIAGAVLNDVGPVLDAAGLARIQSYVGQARSFPTWMHAARAVEETQGVAFPDYTVDQWLEMARRIMVLSSNGRIVFDYDMKIAEAFAPPPPGAEAAAWFSFEALKGRPLLLVRGELSDIMSAQTMAEMVRRVPEAETATVPRVGHAPTLDEPEAVAAIERLLARIA